MLAFNAMDSVVPAFKTDHLYEKVLMAYTYFIKKFQSGLEVIQIKGTLRNP